MRVKPTNICRVNLLYWPVSRAVLTSPSKGVQMWIPTFKIHPIGICREVDLSLVTSFNLKMQQNCALPHVSSAQLCKQTLTSVARNYTCSSVLYWWCNNPQSAFQQQQVQFTNTARRSSTAFITKADSRRVCHVMDADGADWNRLVGPEPKNTFSISIVFDVLFWFWIRGVTGEAKCGVYTGAHKKWMR